MDGCTEVPLYYVWCWEGNEVHFPQCRLLVWNAFSVTRSLAMSIWTLVSVQCQFAVKPVFHHSCFLIANIQEWIITQSDILSKKKVLRSFRLFSVQLIQVCTIYLTVIFSSAIQKGLETGKAYVCCLAYVAMLDLNSYTFTCTLCSCTLYLH